MLGLSAGEMVVIVLIALVMFGGSQLPGLGRNLGEGIRSFRDALRDDKPTSPAPSAAKPDELPPR